MEHEMTKITFCLLFWMILMDGARPTCGRANNLSVENYSVSEGETLTIIFNISGENQQADYIYLVKGSPSIRIIKLLKGEDDGGTCYHEIPRCKENYCLRHSEEKTLNITVRDVTESMEGCYRLYPYCLGSNHHCTTDQPLKSFILSVKDNSEPTEETTIETDSGSKKWVSSGKSNSTQASTITSSGSKEPASKGADNTNAAIITGTVFVTIIVAILIVFLMIVYVHPRFRVRILGCCQDAYTRRLTHQVFHKEPGPGYRCPSGFGPP